MTERESHYELTVAMDVDEEVALGVARGLARQFVADVRVTRVYGPPGDEDAPRIRVRNIEARSRA